MRWQGIIPRFHETGEEEGKINLLWRTHTVARRPDPACAREVVKLWVVTTRKKQAAAKKNVKNVWIFSLVKTETLSVARKLKRAMIYLLLASPEISSRAPIHLRDCENLRFDIDFSVFTMKISKFFVSILFHPGNEIVHAGVSANWEVRRRFSKPHERRMK